jgi:hypothetical protein
VDDYQKGMWKMCGRLLLQAELWEGWHWLGGRVACELGRSGLVLAPAGAAARACHAMEAPSVALIGKTNEQKHATDGNLLEPV